MKVDIWVAADLDRCLIALWLFCQAGDYKKTAKRVAKIFTDNARNGGGFIFMSLVLQQFFLILKEKK